MAAQKTAKKNNSNNNKKKTSSKASASSKKKNTSKKGTVGKSNNNLVALILAAAAVVLLIYFIMIPGAAENGSGLALQFLNNVFSTLFGLVRFCFPFFLLALAWAFFKRKDNTFKFGQFIVFASLLFLSVCACFCLGQGITSFKEFMGIAAEGNGGGVVGGFIGYYLLLMFNPVVSAIILIIVALISLNALCNYVLWHKLVDLCRNGFGSLKEKRAESAERRRDEKIIEARADDFDYNDYDDVPWDEDVKEDKKSADNIKNVKDKKSDSLFAGLFSGKNKKQAEGKKRRKTVEYHSDDKITVDGVTFIRDFDDSEYDVDTSTFRQHLTGKSEIESFIPSYDENEEEPDIGIVAGLQGGYGDEGITTQVFKPADFRDDDDEEIYPLIDAEQENNDNDANKTKGHKYAFEDDFDIPAAGNAEEVAAGDSEINKDSDISGDLADSTGVDVIADDDFQPEAPVAVPAVPVYKLPKVSILTKGSKNNQRQMSREVKENVATLERTLDSFGVQAQVTEVSCGPSLIRYEVQPGPGVKVSKIVSLTDDIALALAAASIRMEAPVPGKSVIGIEVPRKESAPVMFRDILEQSRFFELPSKLTCAYGLDIAGNPVVGDLAGMPHLLIAGTTGSGKSVCMNTMICSILFKATPDEVKFIMIDPKQVEFVIYEGLPHLLTPVVTDPRKAAGALKWALREMENRYTLFNQNRVRNIQGYNALVENDEDKLPQIVIFIDELADLMMVAAKDVEASICRLAQKARAAGIHLVIATQRPSVDVITGLIKANIPSRIALSVSSQIDSRTILDLAGAEKLLGHGDMLYMPVGYSKPLRVQGAWLSDEDARSILDFYRKQGEPEYIEGVAKAPEEIAEEKGADVGDELFYEAAKAAIAAGQASTSMMQRRFRIGYNRAARIMEEMEEKGIIGAAEGAKPRSVLMSLEVFKEKFREPEEQNLFE